MERLFRLQLCALNAIIFIAPLAGLDFNGTSPLTDHFYTGQYAGDRLYFNIYIFDDTIFEKDEYFYVSLNDTDVDIHIQTATVYILDDDSESTCMTIYSFKNGLNVNKYVVRKKLRLHTSLALTILLFNSSNFPS